MSQSGKIALRCGLSEKCLHVGGMDDAALVFCSLVLARLKTCPKHAVWLSATIVHMMGPKKTPVGFCYAASLLALAKLDMGVYVP